QIILPAIVSTKRISEDCGFALIAARIRITAEGADERHKKHHSRDEGGNRISRQAKDYHFPKPAKDYGLSGAHRDLPKIELHAQPCERGPNKIVIADGCAAQRHQEIGTRCARAANAFFGRRQLILKDAKIDRLATGALNESRDGISIGRNDLIL